MTADWDDTYRNALLETDLKRIADAVRIAEETISARLRDVAALNDGGNRKEKADLNTALRDLVALRVKYRQL